MASISIEQPPEATDPDLKEYINRLVTLINVSLGQDAQLVKYTTMPTKMSVGKLYYFTQAIASTPVTGEGVYINTTTGLEKLN